MYEHYWKLRQRPFSAFHSGDHFCTLPCQQALLSKLRYCLLDQPGWGSLQGISGVGKSILLHQLSRSASQRDFQVFHSPGSFTSLDNLLPELQLRFIERDQRSDSVSPQNVLHGLQRNRSSRLLLIDDAQLLTDSKLLPFLKILFETLNHPDDLGGRFSLLFTSLTNVVPQQPAVLDLGCYLTTRFQLPPFTWEETEQYLQQRLQLAGANRFLFDQTAVDQIFRLTQGIAAQVNRLADLSLLAGYVQQIDQISEQQVNQAAEELLLWAA